MDLADAVWIGREFFAMTLLLTAPVVLVSLVIGVLISIGQTVTSIQEQTLTFAPRIVAVLVLLMAMSNWYLRTLNKFTVDIFEFMVESIR